MTTLAITAVKNTPGRTTTDDLSVVVLVSIGAFGASGALFSIGAKDSCGSCGAYGS